MVMKGQDNDHEISSTTAITMGAREPIVPPDTDPANRGCQIHLDGKLHLATYHETALGKLIINRMCSRK
jgi:hypothetical protein